MNEAPLTEQQSEREGQFSLSVILDQIAERANAATPGPWECSEKAYVKADGDGDQFSGGDWIIYPPLGQSGPVGITSSKEIMQFIAGARSDVPKLVKALRRAVQGLEDGISHMYVIPQIEHILREQTGTAADSVPGASIQDTAQSKPKPSFMEGTK